MKKPQQDFKLEEAHKLNYDHKIKLYHFQQEELMNYFKHLNQRTHAPNFTTIFI